MTDERRSRVSRQVAERRLVAEMRRCRELLEDNRAALRALVRIYDRRFKAGK